MFCVEANESNPYIGKFYYENSAGDTAILVAIVCPDMDVEKKSNNVLFSMKRSVHSGKKTIVSLSST